MTNPPNRRTKAANPSCLDPAEIEELRREMKHSFVYMKANGRVQGPSPDSHPDSTSPNEQGCSRCQVGPGPWADTAQAWRVIVGLATIAIRTLRDLVADHRMVRENPAESIEQPKTPPLAGFFVCLRLSGSSCIPGGPCHRATSGSLELIAGAQNGACRGKQRRTVDVARSLAPVRSAKVTMTRPREIAMKRRCI